MVSFSANPKANPVSPRPATRADTSIPKVPKAVMPPIIIKTILLDRPNRETIAYGKCPLVPNLSTTVFPALAIR